MGIYNNGVIFGVRIYNFNEDECARVLFETKYTEPMTEEQMREAYLFYTELDSKRELMFRIYTECSSTQDLQDQTPFMMWYPISLNTFVEKFMV